MKITNPGNPGFSIYGRIIRKVAEEFYRGMQKKQDDIKENFTLTNPYNGKSIVVDAVIETDVMVSVVSRKVAKALELAIDSTAIICVDEEQYKFDKVSVVELQWKNRKTGNPIVINNIDEEDLYIGEMTLNALDLFIDTSEVQNVLKPQFENFTSYKVK